ncbi:zinc finger protein Elbow-like [Schistocerca cancellata]|uniref:zinc finger protein Elbow-like n=1 Tax=Schistocerca cancellata TaxID=274614 RepID=UPI0021186B61|nr:zinc finger protein Elbow-like [Schistocerca cancellata]
MPLACTAPPILPATKTTNGTRATSRAIEQQQQRRRSHVRNSAAAAAAAAAEAATSVSGEQAAAQGGPSSSTVAAILLFVLILPAVPDPAVAAAAAAGAHHNATTPLSLLNPWLSACDIADPATAPDLRGSCSARDAMPSLSDNNHYSNNYDSGVNKQRNNNSSSNYGRDTEAGAAAAAAAEAEMTTGRLNGQVSEGPGPPCGGGGGGGADRECLCGGVRLDEAAAAAACAAAPGRREAALRRLRLRQCCGRAPLDALKPEARAAALRGPAAGCRAHLRALARLDALAATLACKFDELLRRYDCAQDYSVSFGCAHCQVGRSVARVPRRAAPRRTRGIDPPRRDASPRGARRASRHSVRRPLRRTPPTICQSTEACVYTRLSEFSRLTFSTVLPRNNSEDTPP